MANDKHSWNFFRAGGVDQVALKTGEDVARLPELDQKLWVALAVPTKGTEVDERTMHLIDTDKDGRVRPPEVLEAIAWATKVFTNLDVLFQKGRGVALSSLNTTSDEGKEVLASAKRILKEVDRKDAKEVTIDDVDAMAKALASTRFNGDGIVPAESADDETLKKVIEEILGAVGSVTDRSGKPGIDLKLLEQFYADADAAIAWDTASKEAGMSPIEGTEKAAAAVALVESKVDDYFARCKLAAFDARGAAAMSTTEADLIALGAKTLSTGDDGMKRLPLAAVEGGKALPLSAGLNPAWADAIGVLKTDAVTPLLGERDTLSDADWQSIKAKLAPHRDHAAKKPTTKVMELGIPRLAEITKSDARAEIVKLIEQDAALESEFAKIESVEKAVRFRRDFAKLLRNLVNFSDFYTGRMATFQAGKLFLDARSCDLVIYVNDAGKHAALAGLSSAFLAYCDITRPDGEKRSIVAAFTNGDTDDLMVGRNGVFYDRAGKDWDATITSIIDNPISVRQAFWSPYKRLVRLIEEQVAKRAADKEKESTGKIDAAATSAANVDAAAPAPAPAAPGAPPVPAPAAGAPAAAPPSKFDAGTLAAISLVISGIAAFLTAAIGTFLGLGIWMPFGVAAVLLAISGPSMLIAWLKLRRRSLGPILDANGWAINTRAKINVPFGTSLTHLAKLPANASRTLDDPFAERPTPWKRYVVLAIVAGLGIGWLVGKLDGFLPDKYKAATVLHRTPEPAPKP
jgi:hypothetical protein